MAKEKQIFNLLKPVEPPPTVWDKIYNWILGNARIVILITELLIAVAFVGKVVEDTLAKNKDKQIESLRNELSFYAVNKEGEFRDIQRKEDQYAVLWKNSSAYVNILKEIYSYIPNAGADITVKIDADKVSIFGHDDLAFLQKIEQSMKSSTTFSGVAVDTLTISEQESTNSEGKFVLVATINKYFRQPY